MNDILDDFYLQDHRKALDAKFEAQKIAFAPYAFHTALALRNLGALAVLFESGDHGISRDELADKLGIARYGLGVLLEFGLSTEIVKLGKTEPEEPWRYTLGKIGYFILHDRMTRVNMDFMNDVCYRGAAHLEEAVRTSGPAGLKELGDWPTIYEGLSQLPERAQESWFAFDHYYSDNAFPEALPLVFRRPVGQLMDIGGNTAKWSIACAQYDPNVRITIVDLPGQIGMARQNIAERGFQDRIGTHPQDVLKDDAEFPHGHDTVWMSQFLDCFSPDQITGILTRLRLSIDENCDVYILEPLWDMQRYRAASYSLHATSLYFTTMANGDSKMYSRRELVEAIEAAGYAVVEEIHRLGQNDYSLLKFRKNGS